MVLESLNSSFVSHPENTQGSENPEIATVCISQWWSLLSSVRAVFDQCWVCVVFALKRIWIQTSAMRPPSFPSCGKVKGGVWGVENCVTGSPIMGLLCSPCAQALVGCAFPVTQGHTVSTVHGQLVLTHSNTHTHVLLFSQPHNSPHTTFSAATPIQRLVYQCLNWQKRLKMVNDVEDF